MTEDNDSRRDKELRVNEADKNAIRELRDEHFNGAPMGLVARIACQHFVEDNDDGNGGVRL